jgi:hypothetical protein
MSSVINPLDAMGGFLEVDACPPPVWARFLIFGSALSLCDFIKTVRTGSGVRRGMAFLVFPFLSWLRRLGFFAAWRAALLEMVIVIL